jgi:hypothetical protein
VRAVQHSDARHTDALISPDTKLTQADVVIIAQDRLLHRCAVPSFGNHQWQLPLQVLRIARAADCRLRCDAMRNAAPRIPAGKTPPTSSESGLLRELAAFAWQYKIFWLAPIALVIAAILILLFFNYSFAPFHYTVM